MARLIPQNLEAEQSVLGAIFLEPRLMRMIIDMIDRDDFYDERNAYIYDAMRAVFKRETVIDYMTISTELTNEGLLRKAGGVEYLTDLADFLPSTANIDAYVAIVRDLALKRRTIKVAEKIAEEGYNGSIDSTQYIDMAEEMIFDLSKRRKTSQFLTIDQVADQVRSKTELNRDKRGGITGLATGFANVDSLTLGLQNEELLILAARPSMGKSAFAMNIALNVAKRNKRGKAAIAIFSLEMSAEQLVARMLSSESGVDNNKIKGGNLSDNDWRLFEAAAASLSKLNVFFDDSAAVSVPEIRAKCRKLSQEGKLDLVVIDYLQLVKGDSESRGINRQEEVARISRALKQMARELKIPVLALSQLSREVEKREDKKPIMADLRESGSIEQDADMVMFLYRDEYYNKNTTRPNECDLIVAKNRQGAAGIDLSFFFDTQFSRFKAKSPRNDDDPGRPQ